MIVIVGNSDDVVERALQVMELRYGVKIFPTVEGALPFIMETQVDLLIAYDRTLFCAEVKKKNEQYWTGLSIIRKAKELNEGLSTLLMVDPIRTEIKSAAAEVGVDGILSKIALPKYFQEVVQEILCRGK